MLSDQQMKKFGRGYMNYMKEFINTTKSIVATTQFDNKRMLTFSNYIKKKHPGECSRFNNNSRRQCKSSNLAQFQFTTSLKKVQTRLVCFCLFVASNLDHTNGTTKIPFICLVWLQLTHRQCMKKQVAQHLWFGKFPGQDIPITHLWQCTCGRWI